MVTQTFGTRTRTRVCLARDYLTDGDEISQRCLLHQYWTMTLEVLFPN